MGNNILSKSEKVNNLYFYISVIIMLMGIGLFMILSRGQYVYEGDRALYMDDMDGYKIMTNPNTSFVEKICDTNANKVRYVTNTVLALVWKIIGTNFEFEDTIMMVCNLLLVLITWILFYIISDGISDKNRYIRALIATGFALIFSASRFAYYSYEELFGIMENMGNALVLVFATLLIKDSFRFTKKYWIAHIVWIISIYVHERYMVLAGALIVYIFLASIYNRKKIISKDNVLKISFIFMLFIIVFAQRLLLFGNHALEGTGGTNVADTFSIKTLLFMVMREIAYLVGVNVPGDAYLNGIDPRNVNIWIYLITICIWILLGSIVFIFRKRIKANKKEWCVIAFLIILIGCLVASTSITIRVEMRWLYASFGLELMTVCYMVSKILNNADSDLRLYIIVSLVVVLMVGVESYYASNWKNIYNWEYRIDSSELSDEFDNYEYIDNLYILSDSVSPLEDRGIYDLASAEGVVLNNIIWKSSLNDIENIGENDVILIRDVREYDYYDITKEMSNITYVSGYYDDGWCEPYTHISLYSNAEGAVKLSIYVPDYIIFDNEITISVNINNKKCGEYVVNVNELTDIMVEGLEKGSNEIELVSDFWVIEESGRSEDGRLSYVLTNIEKVIN